MPTRPCHWSLRTKWIQSTPSHHPHLNYSVQNVSYINSHSSVWRYANVYVCGLQVLDQYWSPLATQRAVIAPFPLATMQQMTERGDTACPVCLDDMRLFTARITPCSHIFHGQCLRKCIIQFAQCPLCKQPLWQVRWWIRHRQYCRRHQESDENTTAKAVYKIRNGNNKGTVNTWEKLWYIIDIAIKYSFIISFCLNQHISSKS